VSFVDGLDLPIAVLDRVERGWIARLARQVEGETASEMRRHVPEKRLGLLAVYGRKTDPMRIAGGCETLILLK
jgi:hypothetical protein